MILEIPLMEVVKHHFLHEPCISSAAGSAWVVVVVRVSGAVLHGQAEGSSHAELSSSNVKSSNKKIGLNDL